MERQRCGVAEKSRLARGELAYGVQGARRYAGEPARWKLDSLPYVTPTLGFMASIVVPPPM